MTPFSLTLRSTAPTATLELSGRFDYKARKDLKEAYAGLLEDGSIRHLDIVLQGVDYVDSSALGILLLLKERFDEAGKTVALLRPAGTVAQVLEVANFGKLFEIRS